MSSDAAGIENTKSDGLRAVCALYMRVSTKGQGQTTDTQALALREYAQRSPSGWCDEWSGRESLLLDCLGFYLVSN